MLLKQIYAIFYLFFPSCNIQSTELGNTVKINGLNYEIIEKRTSIESNSEVQGEQFTMLLD